MCFLIARIKIFFVHCHLVLFTSFRRYGRHSPLLPCSELAVFTLGFNFFQTGGSNAHAISSPQGDTVKKQKIYICSNIRPSLSPQHEVSPSRLSFQHRSNCILLIVAHYTAKPLHSLITYKTIDLRHPFQYFLLAPD